ncbi:MAG: isoprenyl transferase [Alphaproteobacteria bacterium]
MDHSSHNFDVSLPRHIAVIMDGNGRWAKKRGLPRTLGHKKGSEAAREVVKNAAEAGIEYITLFGFSSENWSRPKDEIQELMTLLKHYLRSQTAEFHKNNARLSVIGDRSVFDKDIIDLIVNAENLTHENTGIHVIIALNYGGRNDILQAASALIDMALETGEKPSEEALLEGFDNALMTKGIPDPDLLIRTSGEQRISNFLLWQCAYAEMFFTPTLWPDFGKDDLSKALQEYANRDRRFGAVKQSEG